MPAEEGLGLNNEERLFPTADSPREDDQEHAIGLGTGWTLHLAAEDDQLLTKQRIFGKELRPGAGKIREGFCQQ